jgi:hypothetical protein
MPENASPTAAEKLTDALLSATVLVSAWLLFQVQPMASKRILPWFGGGPAVWTTSMLFFQTALLVGYLYAHFCVRLLPPRAQAVVHAALLGIAIAAIAAGGVIAGEQWRPADLEAPRLKILAILAATVGLPYLMLSATAPLVQSWWARRHGARSPYRLYALSNAGSLAALISYPILIEPLIGLRVQGLSWSLLFGAYAVLCAASAWRTMARQSAAAAASARTQGEEAKVRSPRYRRSRQEKEAMRVSSMATERFAWVLWLALPMCASVMLLAVTNYLCQDVASMPLLWVAPLAVYLLTFIVAFESDKWYVRWVWFAALAVASFAAAWSWLGGLTFPMSGQVAIQLALLAATGMVCHGEVARMRPTHERLTLYYLCLALGGALGGLFVGVAAPLLFGDFYELPLGTLAAWLLGMIVLAVDPTSRLYRGRRLGAYAAIFLAWTVLAVLAYRQYAPGRLTTVASVRNFFGVLKVQEQTARGLTLRTLANGRVSHGAQFTDAGLRRDPCTYYTKSSGIGRLLAALPGGGKRRVGVVGLGAGTLAAYAEKGDEYRFYDIDPQVVAFAEQYFTYFSDARQRGTQVSIAEGDARLLLERESPQDFDVLVLDAFSGDAIPVHLMTREAFGEYRRHLRKPSGVLAVHVTNLHLDLAPVVRTAAQELGLDVRVVVAPGDKANAAVTSIWMLLARHGETGPSSAIGVSLPTLPDDQQVHWTDDASSLWPLLRSAGR